LSANRLELPGLSLDLSALEPNLTLKTAQELETEISDCERQLLDWQNLLQTVETLAQQKRQQQELERKIEVLDADITDYKELLLMQASGLERLKTLAEVQQKLEALKREELTLTDKKSSIAQHQDNNKVAQKELQSQHQRINNARHQRLDQHPPFTYLEQLPFLPCMEMAELAMPVWLTVLKVITAIAKNTMRLTRNLTGN